MLLLPLMRAFADTQKPRSRRLIDTQSRRQSGDDEDASVDMAYITYSAPPVPSSFPLSPPPFWQSHPVRCQCNVIRSFVLSSISPLDLLQFINNFQSCLE